MTTDFRQYLSLWSGPSKKWHETIFTSFPASTFSGHLQKIAEGQSKSCLFSKEGGERKLNGKQKYLAVCVFNNFVFKNSLILSAYWLGNQNTSKGQWRIRIWLLVLLLHQCIPGCLFLKGYAKLKGCAFQAWLKSIKEVKSYLTIH